MRRAQVSTVDKFPGPQAPDCPFLNDSFERRNVPRNLDSIFRAIA
jgi:hypothetical protein